MRGRFFHSSIRFEIVLEVLGECARPLIGEQAAQEMQRRATESFIKIPFTERIGILGINMAMGCIRAHVDDEHILDSIRTRMQEGCLQGSAIYRETSCELMNRLFAQARGRVKRQALPAALRMLRDDCQKVSDEFTAMARLNLQVHKGRYSVMIAEIVRS